jgi:hypothetical protein
MCIKTQIIIYYNGIIMNLPLEKKKCNALNIRGEIVFLYDTTVFFKIVWGKISNFILFYTVKLLI